MAGSAGIASNPFYQPARQWQIHILADRSVVAAVEEAFADVALATLSFEADEANGEWCVDIITDAPLPDAAVAERLALVSGLLGVQTPRAVVQLLEKKDWVSEVERSFPPLHVGRFYVCGSHVKSPPPLGRIALQVNAGAAFGSGEHATTSGCLMALGNLAKRRRFLRLLDVGCGSGILTIAMAKLWHAHALGVDIDPVSVSVAEENARRNRVRQLTRFAVGDGYNANAVRQYAPFDLIVANILARPLIKMAKSLAENLAPGGVAVLSGLLASQERQVLAAHRLQGLRLRARVRLSGWNTLILQRGETNRSCDYTALRRL